jgi:hypothetical protein
VALKWTTFIVALEFALGCAQPKYAPPASVQQQAEEQTNPCPISLPHLGSCANLQWTQAPTSRDPGRLELKFWSAADHFFPQTLYDPGHTLYVVLWMHGMNHGSLPTSVERLAPGHFAVSNVFFSMHGTWEIQVRLQDGDTLLDQGIYLTTF